MPIHPTLDQLKALKLDGMADAFVALQSRSQAAELGHAEWLALLLDREVATRNTRALPHALARRPPAPRPGGHRGCRLPNAAAARQGAVRAARGHRMDCRAPQSAGHRTVRNRQVVCEPARSPTRHAATATRCTMLACRGCSPISNSPPHFHLATAASPACSARLSKPICRSSTIGGRTGSPPLGGAT